MILLRLRKIQNNQMRNDKYREVLKKSFKCYRKSFSFSWKTEKKDKPGGLYKSSTENMLFFNRNRTFTIYKRAKLENQTFLYWFEEDR